MTEANLTHYNATARYWCVIAAYAAGEISEGMACKILPCDRVELRGLLADALRMAKELESRYRADGTTVAVDAVREAGERNFRGRVCND